MKKRISVGMIYYFLLVIATALENHKDCSFTFINCTNKESYPVLNMHLSFQNNLEEEVNDSLRLLKYKKKQFPNLQCDVDSCEEKLKNFFESMFLANIRRKTGSVVKEPNKMETIFTFVETPPISKNEGLKLSDSPVLAANISNSLFYKLSKESEEIVKGNETKTGKRWKRHDRLRHQSTATDCIIKKNENASANCRLYPDYVVVCFQWCKKRKGLFHCIDYDFRKTPLGDCVKLSSCEKHLKVGETGQLHCSQKPHKNPTYCKICGRVKHFRKFKCHKNMKHMLKKDKQLHCPHL